MKYLLLICCFLAACNGIPEEAKIPVAQKLVTVSSDHFYQVKLDGCEYIFFENPLYSGKFGMVHKGNCKNKAHFENQSH